MEKFINLTTDGNEKAIKKGTVVPDGAINLSWVKTPKLNPQDNMVIIDTSKSISENAPDDLTRSKLYYANNIGVLEDEYGNTLIDQEYPIISDVFSVQEDFSINPGSEYTEETILPYLHVSRYFHLAAAGSSIGQFPRRYDSEYIRIIDEKGRDYTDDQGNRRYSVFIIPSTANLDEEEWAYRVHVYVDTNENEGLYLSYNKIEVDGEGVFSNQNINHKEILNPQPYFMYRPEESEVTDPANRDKPWYSTKPAGLKDQVLGKHATQIDGYQVTVPRKAIPDTRIFQTFQWRVMCDFIENVQIDPFSSLAQKKIRCAVVTTTANASSKIPVFMFYNMEKSQYNATGVQFENPLFRESPYDENLLGNIEEAKKSAEYWKVNFDLLQYADLAKYDLLVWPIRNNDIDVTPYLGKIKYFTEQLGGTILFDTHNLVGNFEGLGITVTAPRNALTGEATGPGPSDRYVLGDTIRPASDDYGIIMANGPLGGWDLETEELATICEYKSHPTAYFAEDKSYLQHIYSYPDDYEEVFVAEEADGTEHPIAIRKKYSNTSGGNIIFSTFGYCGTNVSTIRDEDTQYFLSYNDGQEVYGNDTDFDYQGAIDSAAREGVYKSFFNICLLAVKGTMLSDDDERRYSTVWSAGSHWRSSWVIDATRLNEHERNKYDFRYIPRGIENADLIWQRALSEKTLFELVSENISSNMTAEERQKLLSSTTREYRIETTNSLVEFPETLLDESIPYAWTEAYSPVFQVPADFGPHVVVDEEIAGEYAAGQYLEKSYPDRPYKFRVASNYYATSEETITKNITFTVTGTAHETITGSTPLRTENTKISWSSHGQYGFTASPHAIDFGTPRPLGVTTWSLENYHKANTWGFYGMLHALEYGQTSDYVYWLQHFLNAYQTLSGTAFTTGEVHQTGYFDITTAQALAEFQLAAGARFVNGLKADTETYYLIGAQVLRFGARAFIDTGIGASWKDPYGWVELMMNPVHMSNENNLSFSVASSTTNSPDWAVDVFAIKFPEAYNFHAITVVPFVPDFATNHIHVDAIDVYDDGNDDVETVRTILRDWDPSMARFQIKRDIPSGTATHFDVGPFTGNMISVTLAQRYPAGPNTTARVLGLTELCGWASTQTGGISYTSTERINISSTVTMSVTPNGDITKQITPNYTGTGILTNIVWDDVTEKDEDVYPETGYDFEVVVDEVHLKFKGSQVTARHSNVVINNDVGYGMGPAVPPINSFVPDSQFYSMDENGIMSPMPESGMVSKKDGIKLICTSTGRPYAFPSLPTAMGPNEAQRHFTTFTLSSIGSGSNVKVGFYDRQRKEFIQDTFGQPVISFIDYMYRNGPDNVYVAVVSDYEEKEIIQIPSADDAPSIPFRWAMPVYGVTYKKQARIGIEPLPANLDNTDMWPVPVRIGSFEKKYKIPSRYKTPITSSWLGQYQRAMLSAYYSIPESVKAGWSTIYGRPNYDIKDETPILLDDNVIQVKKPPILMVKEPTIFASNADPTRPVFKVYTRASINTAWSEVEMIDILDYNTSTGEIILRNPIAANDPNLVKVSYTSPRNAYMFKGWNDNRLNLNPLPEYGGIEIGKPVYIYIVPEYVKDQNGSIITDSIQTTTLRFTYDPGVFDPLHPDYDIFAIQLGVIYITPLNIKDLIMLDTRRRGGGVKDSMTLSEISRVVKDSMYFWDMGYGAGTSYQNGGFIIIRLPEEVRDNFPDETDIIEVIERNITTGVQYIIEDSEGNVW